MPSSRESNRPPLSSLPASVAEGLANVAKHAEPASASVDAQGRDNALRLRVRVGGADPAHGSGLIGLSDRVQALGGAISVESPPGSWTLLAVTRPIMPAPE